MHPDTAPSSTQSPLPLTSRFLLAHLIPQLTILPLPRGASAAWCILPLVLRLGAALPVALNFFTFSYLKEANLALTLL